MAMPTLDRLEPWEFDDLWQLPDEVVKRCEIVDGVLNVSPPPSQGHELVVDRLHRLLAAAVGIDLGASHRVPDLTIVRRSSVQPDAYRAQPADVALTIEVVSPTSRTTDRITKPAQYAAAGIGAYWRVEPQEPGLTAYTLEPRATVYTEVGRWGSGETARPEQPFDVGIDIDALFG